MYFIMYYIFSYKIYGRESDAIYFILAFAWKILMIRKEVVFTVVYHFTARWKIFM